MSQDIKYKKRSRKKIFIGLLFFIIIYLLISFLTTIFGASKKTVLPEIGILYSKIAGQGFIIKNETVYKSEGSGQLNFLVNEGERVPVGVEIATISQLKDTSKLKQELIQIEQRIKTLSINEKSSDDKSLSEAELIEQGLIEDIQLNISNKNFVDIQSNKEEFNIIDNKSLQDNTLLDQSLDALKEKRDLLNKQINSNNLKCYSKISGIVSYDIDGYEEVYIPKEFENYTYDKLIINQNNDKETNSLDIAVGNPMFKIINNYEWYLAIKIEDKIDVEKYEIGQTILFELEDGKELKGRMISKNITNNNAVVVLKLTDYLHNYYNIRNIRLDIINYKKEGFKIPTKVIFEKEGEKGVYIKEINGIVKFRRIAILGEEGDYTYINKGDNNGYINIEGQEDPVKTVTLFNEIFINPQNVTEGEILK